MYGLRLFFNVKLKVKGYKLFSMTLHIFAPESTTVQNFKFRPSYACLIKEEEEEEEEEDDEQCGKLHRLI